MIPPMPANQPGVPGMPAIPPLAGVPPDQQMVLVKISNRLLKSNLRIYRFSVMYSLSFELLFFNSPFTATFASS